eukprot:14363946-Ditylum_brightwellii.AAC.1
MARFPLPQKEGMADSGASSHMLNEKIYFILYVETPGAYIALADKTKVPILGKGTTLIDFSGHIVKVLDCLHLPSLCTPLHSICHHCKYQGCAFIADNDDCYLTFPSRTINVDDSEDSLISICPAPHGSKVDFNACPSAPQHHFRKVIFPTMYLFALVIKSTHPLHLTAVLQSINYTNTLAIETHAL